MPVAIVFGKDPRRPWLAARSERSLRLAGFEITEVPQGPCLLLKSGHVLAAPEAYRPPPDIRALIAVGLPPDGEWTDLHAIHGGDYPSGSLPAPVCEWHSSAETAAVRLTEPHAAPVARVVHWAPLDLAPCSDALCVFEVVTSLQHGGAEKIALDLAAELPAHGVASRLVILGQAHRRTLDGLPGMIDLSHLPRSGRMAYLTHLAIRHGVDVLHLHLTDAVATCEVASAGIPVLVTMHNSRAGWPLGWESIRREDVGLMLACSKAVEADLRGVFTGFPVRTVWNGIRPETFPETPMPSKEEGFVIACVANPRPQKRLDLLPSILTASLAEFKARGMDDINLRLVIAGETSASLADAVACRAMVEQEATRLGVVDRISWTEGLIPVREVLAGAHLLVSCSAHEGLSLAHLEALSSGRPVVACDTGGTRELAWRNPAMTLLDAAATPNEFARAIVDALLAPPPSAHRLVWRDFTTSRMTSRVARFCRQLASRNSESQTIWFISNNLSTGGAQSSLRRMVKEFHRRSIPVRLALLQEYPEHPTPGRLDLLEHGIDVFVPQPSGLIEPAESVDLILEEMAADPPATLVFWNAITVHKMLLADALPFTKVHDVSPGEMWFSAFERCLENPPPGVPIRNAADYGVLLDSMVVKYSAEAKRAAALGTRVAVIPNGVELPAAPRRRAMVDGALVFGTAARISPQKRLDELIAAFRIALPDLPEYVLRIAGGIETGAEDCAAALRGQSADLPVEWLGETSDVASFHSGCDVFVMISDPAGCPNASLEALASGLPVIATDVGGASEQVVDGVNGRLVPARDVSAFARAMVEMAADSSRFHAMGDAGRQWIRERFLLERMTSDYLRHFAAESVLVDGEPIVLGSAHVAGRLPSDLP